MFIRRLKKTVLIICIILNEIIVPTNVLAQTKITKDIEEIKKDIVVIKEGQKAINKRIDDVNTSLNNKRIDDLRQEMIQQISTLRNIMLGGFGVLFSGMCFVIWDRRTTLAPVIKEVEGIKEKTVEEVLKGYAKKEVRFKEVMQAAGLV
jgi:cell division protein FtsB